MARALSKIKEGLLSDYRVVILGVDDLTISKWIKNRELLKTESGEIMDSEYLGAQIGLLKAIMLNFAEHHFTEATGLVQINTQVPGLQTLKDTQMYMAIYVNACICCLVGACQDYADWVIDQIDPDRLVHHRPG